ncbi:MAG: hypothetical protein RML56_14480, partial [Burkholderiales bacterium]|nr:hypothetical protein [Burkholderiales bacterium]
MRSANGRSSGRIFISHTHWDHINTVLLAPLLVCGNQIELFGPYQGDLTIERAISAQMESVYFPVTVREFAAPAAVSRPARGNARVRSAAHRHDAAAPPRLLPRLQAFLRRPHGVLHHRQRALPAEADPRYDARHTSSGWRTSCAARTC